MTTPTMRERLARAICRYRGIDPDAPGDEPPAPNWQDFLGDVDAILAELRDFRPPKDSVFLRFFHDADGMEDNLYADETDYEVFTAMIDAIRGLGT